MSDTKGETRITAPRDFDKFRDFAQRIMSVPRSAIQPQLDAERERKRTSKSSASRDSDASSTSER
jgi:hypothetical protein